MAAAWHWGNTCLLVCKRTGHYEQFLCLATGDIKGAEYLGTNPPAPGPLEALGNNSMWEFPHPQPGLLTRVPKTPGKALSAYLATSKLPIPTPEMCSLQTSGWLLAMPHPHTQAW